MLQNADLSTVFDGLNVLGRVPWRINKEVTAVARQCWNGNIPLGDIPSQDDFDMPEKPLRPARISKAHFEDKESTTFKEFEAAQTAYWEANSKYSRIRQKNMVRDACWFNEGSEF